MSDRPLETDFAHVLACELECVVRRRLPCPNLAILEAAAKSLYALRTSVPEAQASEHELGAARAALERFEQSLSYSEAIKTTDDVLAEIQTNGWIKLTSFTPLLDLLTDAIAVLHATSARPRDEALARVDKATARLKSVVAAIPAEVLETRSELAAPLNEAKKTLADAHSIVKAMDDDHVADHEQLKTVLPVLGKLLGELMRLRSTANLFGRVSISGDLADDVRECRKTLADLLHKRVPRHSLRELYGKVRKKARESKLTGLAISGGGIRSATLGLGFMQGLARHGLLDRFDYLSTVSGGGYIGAWLTSWIRREGEHGSDGLANVAQQLFPARAMQARAERILKKELCVDEEPEPIYHLRAHSKYLAPRGGLLSADRWSLISVYVRNLLLNLLFLVPLAMGVAFGVRLLQAIFTAAYSHKAAMSKTGLFEAVGRCSFRAALIAITLAGLAFLAVAVLFLGRFARAGLLSRPDVSVKDYAGPPAGRTFKLHYCVFIWLMLSAFTFSLLALLADERWEPNKAWIDMAILVAIGAASHLILRFSGDNSTPRLVFQSRPRRHAYLAALLSGAAGATFIYFTAVLVHRLERGSATMATLVPAATLTVGPAALLFTFFIVASIETGFHGSAMEESEREWWASIGARILIYSFAWLAVFGLILFGPMVVLYFTKPGIQWSLAAGWLATAIGGALAGKSDRTGGGNKCRRLDLLGRIAPTVFVVGLAIAVSLAAAAIVAPEDSWSKPSLAWYVDGLNRAEWASLCSALAGCAAAAIIVGSYINANLFSMHSLYANRLIRCYLGASRAKSQWKDRDLTPQTAGAGAGAAYEISEWGAGRGGAPTNVSRPVRQDNYLTGFDEHDDDNLAAFRIRTDRLAATGYRGPLLIVNTALNLVAGKELAWQERKAESFVLTPLFCGSKSTGYRKTPRAERNGERPELTLGRAIAISGAAASPNMGYHSSAPLTALMTVFNVRLGWWMQNPNIAEEWTGAGPGQWKPLLYELFGRTDAEAEYVYLSDGGHFENLGIYELVRRRCKFIVAIDSGADGDYTFDDLGNMLRKCRTDFGVRIEIDLTTLRPTESPGRSRWHCTIGTIRYEEVDDQESFGTLLYVKASLTGNEPADVLEYAANHRRFPHESTADQFFSESQFESYRALGYHMANEVFRDTAKFGDRSDQTALFAHLRRRWFPPPPRLEEEFLQSVRGFSAIHSKLQTDKNLRDFSRELYPELQELSGATPEPVLPRHHPDRTAAELHIVTQMLQVMENAWLQGQLGEYGNHPLNYGWANVFRRWTNSPTFNRLWSILRGEFSHGFIQFCREQLQFTVREPILERMNVPNSERLKAWKPLIQEFVEEWPDEHTTLENRALNAFRVANRRMVWTISLRPAGPQKTRFPIGLIVVGPVLEGRQELFIWIRGPYRNLGVGRAVLSQKVDAAGNPTTDAGSFTELDRGNAPPGAVETTASESTTLLEWIQKHSATELEVCFPKAENSRHDGRFEREQWKHFFNHYGFNLDLDSLNEGRPLLKMHRSSGAR